LQLTAKIKNTTSIMEQERLDYINLILQSFGNQNNQLRKEAETTLVAKCLKSINSLQILVDLISSGPSGTECSLTFRYGEDVGLSSYPAGGQEVHSGRKY
jgi:hypothetical protein